MRLTTSQETTLVPDITDIIARVREELDDFPLINEPALSADIRALLDEIEGRGNLWAAEEYERKFQTARAEAAEAELARLREETAGSIMAAEINSAPEPLQRLGKWLADKLDAEDFNTAEPMLLAAVAAHSGLMKRLGQLENSVSILQSERREAVVELARLRAPVEGEAGALVATLIADSSVYNYCNRAADLITRQAARIAEVEAQLHTAVELMRDLEQFFDGRADADVDGPNDEMRHLVAIRQWLDEGKTYDA